MNFDRPLSKVEGWIIYTALMDYIDNYVHNYTKETKGKEFPSLRQITDKLLTLLNDFQHLDLSGLDANKNNDELIEEINNRLILFKETSTKQDLDSKKMGLFLQEEETSQETEEAEPPLKPLKFNKEAKAWLKSVGIKPK